MGEPALGARDPGGITGGTADCMLGVAAVFFLPGLGAQQHRNPDSIARMFDEPFR